jgi:hypothetical protein
MEASEASTVLTIGHSNRTWKDFRLYADLGIRSGARLINEIGWAEKERDPVRKQFFGVATVRLSPMR